MKFLENQAIFTATKIMRQALYTELNANILSYDIAPTPSQAQLFTKANFNKNSTAGNKLLLYAHIPFCDTFCPFCSFHKYAYDAQIALSYFKSLRKQLRAIKDAGFSFDSMYIGGGTTLINENELEKTLILARDLFDLKEISCESDPNHLDNLERFKGLITRLSIGVQSFDDDILRRVSRLEKFGDSKTLITKIQKAMDVLPILSLDLIFNFPSQNKEMLLRDIQTAKMLNPQQITFYPLMKSSLTKDKIAASLGVEIKDNEREFYELICALMQEYSANNAWSFARKDKISSTQDENFNHKMKDEYCADHTQYIGAGSGAFSFINGRLYINAFDLNEYCERVNSGRSAVIAINDFSKRARMLYLFLTKIFSGSLNLDEFINLYSVNERELGLLLRALKICGAITQNGQKIELSKFGRYLMVVLMKEFYIGMDRVRAVFKAGLKPNIKRLKIMSESL